MEKHTPRLSAQILEEASAWFIDFNEENVDRLGHEAFNAWLRRSPEHVRAFLRISALWEDAGAVSKRRLADLDGLIARARSEQNVFPLAVTARERSDARAEAAPRGRTTRRYWLGAAASLLLGVATVTWYTTMHSEPAYVTGIGEQRSITLEDGSSVELNARSKLRVDFTEHERAVHLLEGQALFTVVKNPARPFVVTTDDARLRAVGTRFDVYRKRTGTVVTVVEGRVAVGSTDKVLLAAGEQMTITPIAMDGPTPVDTAAATAWTEKQLVFESTPLRDVVEEFNRYNRRQLVIRDPGLHELHVSGVFASTDSSRMVEFLRQRFAVSVSYSSDEIEIWRGEPSPR